MNGSWELVTLLTILVALAVEPVCSVTPEELPQQGETLVIEWNETLLVAEGEFAVLNGTITVQGNGTVTPVFRIGNRGELRVGENVTLRCENATLILDNLGTIAGESLLLESLQGGNLTLLHRNSINLDSCPSIVSMVVLPRSTPRRKARYGSDT